MEVPNGIKNSKKELVRCMTERGEREWMREGGVGLGSKGWGKRRGGKGEGERERGERKGGRGKRSKVYTNE